MRVIASMLAALTLASMDSPASARDWDGNPPGWRGGPGTNWENPPGRRGGPGVSPDRHWYGHYWAPRYYWNGGYWHWHPTRACWARDRDGNPPGPAGGPGTNWENPPGPAGGPGASPNRNFCR